VRRLTAIVKKFKNLELAKKLIWINFLLIVLPLSIMSVISFSSFSGTMEDKIGNFQSQITEQVTANLDTYMNELDRLSLMPYQYPEVMKFLSTPKEPNRDMTLEQIEYLNTFVGQVFINGRIDIVSVSLFGEKGAGYMVLPETQYMTAFQLEQQSDWLSKTRGNQGKVTFIGTHEVKARGNVYQLFSVARQLRNFETNESVGYILIDIEPTIIRDILSEVNLENNANLYITDENGKLIASQQKFMELPQQLGTLNGSGLKKIDLFGKRQLVTYYTSPVTGWTTIGIVPVDELLEDTYLVRNTIIIISSICFGLALIASVVIAIRITNPIRRLGRLMKRVENGDLKVVFPIHTEDEIGQLGSAFNRMVAELSELGYRLYETELREKDAQISALQSKINPHFLYNTLGSISMFAEVEGNKEVVQMTNSLSKLLRYAISGTKDKVQFHEELEHVKGYMVIQKIRYEDRLHFEVDIDEELLHYYVIRLFLQPIVENAINHGIDRGNGQGRIQLVGNKEADRMILKVIDNGHGMTSEKLELLRNRLRNKTDAEGPTGNGLINVHRRIILQYGEAYGLDLESMPYSGTKVTITLPLMTTKE
jgi:two-component system sensor histidine kinase YesM